MTASASSPCHGGEELPLLAAIPPVFAVDVYEPDSVRSPLLKRSSLLAASTSPPPGSLHACRGLIYVALSAVCFSLVSTCAKYATYSISSMEFIFWRSIVALALNYVREFHALDDRSGILISCNRLCTV